MLDQKVYIFYTFSHIVSKCPPRRLYKFVSVNNERELLSLTFPHQCSLEAINRGHCLLLFSFLWGFELFVYFVCFDVMCLLFFPYWFVWALHISCIANVFPSLPFVLQEYSPVDPLNTLWIWDVIPYPTTYSWGSCGTSFPGSFANKWQSWDVDPLT